MIEIETLTELDAFLIGGASLDGAVFQNLDLRSRREVLLERSLAGAMVLGCKMDDALRAHASASGGIIFPELPNVPFSPYRAALYSIDELYDTFDWRQPDSYARCFDARVYAHYLAQGKDKPPSIVESLARRLHDHAITDAVEEMIEGRWVVAIMGGHAMLRSEKSYADVARIARALTQKGFLLASGGGPGAMEATHVGAWFASRYEAEMREAIAVLSQAPGYEDGRWLSAAFEVRERWPFDGAHQSLGIPTWLYGHEPPNAFATHVAKYFANSVREDGLLAIAKGGVIFSRGSAGTIQEIFQDACQNHYESHGGSSPMVFLDRAYWTEDKPVYPLLRQLAEGRSYARWLSITDDVDEAVEAIAAFAARG